MATSAITSVAARNQDRDDGAKSHVDGVTSRAQSGPRWPRYASARTIGMSTTQPQPAILSATPTNVGISCAGSTSAKWSNCSRCGARGEHELELTVLNTIGKRCQLSRRVTRRELLASSSAKLVDPLVAGRVAGRPWRREWGLRRIEHAGQERLEIRRLRRARARRRLLRGARRDEQRGDHGRSRHRAQHRRISASRTTARRTTTTLRMCPTTSRCGGARRQFARRSSCGSRCIVARSFGGSNKASSRSPLAHRRSCRSTKRRRWSSRWSSRTSSAGFARRRRRRSRGRRVRRGPAYPPRRRLGVQPVRRRLSHSHHVSLGDAGADARQAASRRAALALQHLRPADPGILRAGWLRGLTRTAISSSW